MKLICPSCGAVHSVEAWKNDAIARQCLKLAGEMQHEISRGCFAYLALFRSDGRSLQWKKVLRLLFELKELTTVSHIQWKNQVARPNSAYAWGLALDRVTENPPKGLPLKSHGYLRAIAYEIADEMDRKAEVNRNKKERESSSASKRSTPPIPPSKGDLGRCQAMPERLSIEDMVAIREKNYRIKEK